MPADQFLDRLRGVPSSAVPREQDLPLDRVEHLAQERPGIFGGALRVRLDDRTSGLDVECAVETKRVVGLGHLHAPLLPNRHPHPPERRKTPKLGLVFEEDGSLCTRCGHRFDERPHMLGVVRIRRQGSGGRDPAAACAADAST